MKENLNRLLLAIWVSFLIMKSENVLEFVILFTVLLIVLGLISNL